MDKYDVKKVHKGLYAPSAKEFTIVDVPMMRYIAVDGQGDPNTSADYAYAVEALYGVAYTVKFTSKKSLGRDLVVAPLEGLWWADDPTVFLARQKETWQWTMLISQPDWITEDMIADAVAEVRRKNAVKKKPDNPALAKLRLRPLTEGICAQILHIGSYDDETPTLRRLHDEFMPDNGFIFNGNHHEIYLSDPRRTDPAKLKTILRQPVTAR